MKPRWLPDWKDPNNYPDPKNTTSLQWSWQFLRRNVAYQRQWTKVIKPTVNQGKTKREKYSGPILAFKEKFHIMALDLDPPPSPSENDANDLRFDAAFILYRGPSGGGPIHLNLPIEQNEMLVVFNLRRPIAPQLARVERALIEAEKAESQTAKFRRRVNHYQTYLRLLDAKTSDAVEQTIVQTLYPKLASTYPDRNALQRLRDHMRAAERLRDHDFWLIAFMEQK
jgi:hypothetical protein